MREMEYENRCEMESVMDRPIKLKLLECFQQHRGNMRA